MPFTVSHAAAVLPFLRMPLLPGALAIGAIAPDLPYFVPLGVPRDLSHSPLGLVTLDLAIGIGVSLLWYVLLRRPVIDLLPSAIRRRMPTLGFTALRGDRSRIIGAALLVAAVLLGGGTHLIWDVFTHDGPVATALGFERKVGPFSIRAWFQYLSSLIGILILAMWGIRWVRRTPPEAPEGAGASAGVRWFAWGSVIVAGVGGALIVVVTGAVGDDGLTPSRIFRMSQVSIGAAGAMTAIVIGIWWLDRALRSARDRARL